MSNLLEEIAIRKREIAATRANNASKNFECNDSLAVDTNRTNNETQISTAQTNSYLVDSTYESFHSIENVSARYMHESKKKLLTNGKENDAENIASKSLLKAASKPASNEKQQIIKPILSRCLSDTRIKAKQSTQANDSKSMDRSTSFHQLDASEILTINGRLYRKDKQIGKGGSSLVWSALDNETKLEVAIKIVSLNEDQAVTNAYKNEIKILEQFRNCQHVIHLYDYEFVDEKQLLYIVLEKGDTDFGTYIKKRHRDKQINDKFIHFYWEEMLHCVQTIHRKGIIHKDLKPANFLLVSGYLKLIDFGISSCLSKNEDSVCLSETIGTPSYMAPERLCESAHIKITTKVDVWSLGCMLYVIAYGTTPFQKYKSNSDKVNAICDPKVEIEYPPHHDELLIETIKMCLVRDEHYRASVSDLLAHSFCDSKRKQQAPDVSHVIANLAADLLSKTPNSRQRELEKLCNGLSSMKLSTSQLDL